MNDMNDMNILSKVLSDGTMLEAIYDPSKGGALVVSREGKIQEVGSCEIDGTRYAPLVDWGVESGVVLLPPSIDEDVDPRALLNQVETAIGMYVDVGEGFTSMAARFVLATYVYERFEKVPYLRVMGPWGSGKSRFLKVMRSLCFHSINLGSNPTNAVIYRLLSKYGGVLIMDEMDFDHSDMTSAMTRILNSGYDRDLSAVLRTNMGTYAPEGFNAFGPKVLATRRSFRDNALESRMITHVTSRTARGDIPIAVPSTWEWEEMKRLRSLLLGFRLEFFHSIESTRNVRGLQNYDPRTQEVLRPLFLAVGEETIPDHIRPYLDEYVGDQRAYFELEEEALAVSAIDRSASRGARPTVGEIASEMGRALGSPKRFAPRRVGNILRSIGVTPIRRAGGYVIEVTPAKLAQLKRRFLPTENSRPAIQQTE